MTATAPASPAAISTKHAPALDLPARFMALAMLLLALSGILSPWAYPLLLDGFYAPRLLAFVHLNTLGVVAAMVVGAGYQLVPVVLQTPLASVRLGRVSFWCHLVGVSLFLPGVMTTWHPGLAAGAALVFSGLALYLVDIGWTLGRAPHRDVVFGHIAAAQFGLGGGIVAGLLLALNKGSGFLGPITFRLLAAHATLMLGGWVMVMLNGVAYRLVGMFTLSEDRLWQRVAWAELVLSSGGAWLLAGGLLTAAGRGLLAAGALAILAGQALLGIQLLHLYRVRRRRGFDIHIPYALAAIASGLVGAVLLTGGILGDRPIDAPVWVAVGWLAIAGVALSAIQGFFYKIATFLVWLHRYAPLAGRRRVPRLEQMYGPRLARLGWALWLAALALSLTAVLAENRPLAVAAGITAAAGLGCFLANVARIATHAWPTAAGVFQHATRGRVPEIGKEGHIS
jgi:hypothetical protein